MQLNKAYADAYGLNINNSCSALIQWDDGLTRQCDVKVARGSAPIDKCVGTDCEPLHNLAMDKISSMDMGHDEIDDENENEFGDMDTSDAVVDALTDQIFQRIVDEFQTQGVLCTGCSHKAAISYEQKSVQCEEQVPEPVHRGTQCEKTSILVKHMAQQCDLNDNLTDKATVSCQTDPLHMSEQFKLQSQVNGAAHQSGAENDMKQLDCSVLEQNDILECKNGSRYEAGTREPAYNKNKVVIIGPEFIKNFEREREEKMRLAEIMPYLDILNTFPQSHQQVTMEADLKFADSDYLHSHFAWCTDHDYELYGIPFLPNPEDQETEEPVNIEVNYDFRKVTFLCHPDDRLDDCLKQIKKKIIYQVRDEEPVLIFIFQLNSRHYRLPPSIKMHYLRSFFPRGATLQTTVVLFFSVSNKVKLHNWAI